MEIDNYCGMQGTEGSNALLPWSSHSSTLQLEPQCHPQLLQYEIATVVSFRYAALSCTVMVAREVYAVIRSLRSECILTDPLFFTLLGMTGTTPGIDALRIRGYMATLCHNDNLTVI